MGTMPVMSWLGRATARGRPWTRLGTVANAAHGFYELASGVGIPSASLAGPVPATVVWTAASLRALQLAGRRDRLHDFRFGMLNGMFLTAVLTHFIFWPKRWVAGLPYLAECEGLRGNVLAPYNAILYVSVLSGVAGVLENGRAGIRGARIPVLFVPVLIRLQSVEFRRLKAQARREPRWWNRRLQQR